LAKFKRLLKGWCVDTSKGRENKCGGSCLKFQQWRLRQEDYKLHVSLSYIARPCLQTKGHNQDTIWIP
jgi:hypothetical protein